MSSRKFEEVFLSRKCAEPHVGFILLFVTELVIVIDSLYLCWTQVSEIGLIFVLLCDEIQEQLDK